MSKLIIYIISFCFPIITYGQKSNCEEILIKAESSYASGRLNDITRICECLSYYTTDSGDIKPKRQKVIYQALEENDKVYGAQLQSFYDFKSELRNFPTKFLFQEGPAFTKVERMRAYRLLSKVYKELGTIELSEFFIKRILIESPLNELEIEDGDKEYERIFNTQMKTLSKISLGGGISTYFSLPMNKTINFEGSSFDKLKLKFIVSYALQLNYIPKDQTIFGLKIIATGNNIKYGKELPDAQTQIIDENFSFIKTQFLFKYIPSKKEKTRVLTSKWFFEAGYSLDYLYNSNTYVDNRLLAPRSLNTLRNRNRFNHSLIFGTGIRIRILNGYLNAGFNIEYALLPILNYDSSDQSQVEETVVSSTFGLKENNYHIGSGYWNFMYERRFNIVKKKKKIEF